MIKIKKPMTVKQAFNVAIKTFKVSMGNDGQNFTALGWKSQESGNRSGPFFISIFDGVAIEVDRNGKFKSVYSERVEGYFPWYGTDIQSERP